VSVIGPWRRWRRVLSVCLQSQWWIQKRLFIGPRKPKRPRSPLNGATPLLNSARWA